MGVAPCGDTRVALRVQAWGGARCPFQATQKERTLLLKPRAPVIRTGFPGGRRHGGAERPGAGAVVSPDGTVIGQVAPQAAESSRRPAGGHRHSAGRVLLSTGPDPHLWSESMSGARGSQGTFPFHAWHERGLGDGLTSPVIQQIFKDLLCARLPPSAPCQRA